MNNKQRIYNVYLTFHFLKIFSLFHTYIILSKGFIKLIDNCTQVYTVEIYWTNRTTTILGEVYGYFLHLLLNHPLFTAAS